MITTIKTALYEDSIVPLLKNYSSAFQVTTQSFFQQNLKKFFLIKDGMLLMISQNPYQIDVDMGYNIMVTITGGTKEQHDVVIEDLQKAFPFELKPAPDFLVERIRMML